MKGKVHARVKKLHHKCLAALRARQHMNRVSSPFRLHISFGLNKKKTNNKKFELG